MMGKLKAILQKGLVSMAAVTRAIGASIMAVHLSA